MCRAARSDLDEIEGRRQRTSSLRRGRPPEVFYFGELSGAEQCSVACAREPACAAFTYMGAASGGWGFGNDAAKWARQCYGRSNQVMTTVPDKNKISGVKVAYSEKRERDRMLGVDPAAIGRGERQEEAGASQGQQKEEGRAGRASPGQAGGARPQEETDLMSLLGGKARAGQAAGQAAGAKAGEQMDLASLLGGKARAGQTAGQAGQAAGADEEMDLMSLLGGKGKAGQAAGGKAGEQMDLASLLGGKARAGQAAGQAAGAKADEEMDLASLLAQGRAKQAAGQAGQAAGAQADEEMDLMSLLGGKGRAGQAAGQAGQAAGGKASEQMDLASLLAKGRAGHGGGGGGSEEAAGAVAAEAAARVVPMEAVHGAQGAWDCMWVLVRPLRACKSLCERSSGMSFICAIKRAGCIVWLTMGEGWAHGQPCCGEGRAQTLELSVWLAFCGAWGEKD